MLNKVKLSYLLLIYLTSFLSLPLYATCTVTDGFNHTIQLKKPAKRIITLTPNVTEILFSIGAGTYVVGSLQGSDYPLAARKIRHIGSYSGIDVKKIIALNPDLIVTWGDIFSRQVVTLRKQGIPIYTTKPHQLEDIPLIMKDLGCLTGMSQNAVREADYFSYKLGKIRKQYQTEKPLTVFFQMSRYSLITINKNSWINQVISVCGGRNVFADTQAITPQVSLESVLLANPEVIISDVPGQDWKKRWKTWDDISAVKHNQLFTIDPDLIEQASPRLLKGTEKICKYLQTARAAGRAIILAQKNKIGRKITI